MARCVKCKRDGWWSIECVDCLVEEIKGLASEIMQLEAMKKEAEAKMAAELARERSMVQNNPPACIRCGEPRNIQNIPWCEKCLRQDGLQIRPDQIPKEGQQRRWCAVHLRLENGPPWECFPAFNKSRSSELSFFDLPKGAEEIKQYAKYQIPEGAASEQEEQDLEKAIRERFPK